MSENTSWLKKPSTMLPRRNIPAFNVTDNNSINLLNPNQAQVAFRPPARKSCMAFKKRKTFTEVPPEKKGKPNDLPPKTEFKNRTLKMVQGQRLSMNRPGTSRLSTLPKPDLRLRASPLHKSTPCQAPRSILRLNKNEMSASKRVNFDPLTDIGVGPLQESTIQEFTQYDLRKPATTSKVDASTNTDEIEPEPDNDKSNIYDFLVNFKKEIFDKIDSLTENPCPCKTPEYRFKNNDVQQQQQQQFELQTKLSNVEEEDEEESGSVKTDQTPAAEAEKENVPEEAEKSNVSLKVEMEAIMDQAISSSLQVENKQVMKVKVMDNEQEVTNVSTSDNEEKNRESKLKLSSPVMAKLRNLRRRRQIPIYLQSFELSPKAKRGRGNALN